jgi:hypothetical protein
MGAMAKVAADQHDALSILHAQYEKSGTYDGDDELRTAVTTALAGLDEFTTKLRAVEDSTEYTPAGVTARRRTLREPLLLAAERAEQRAGALERHIAKSEDEAWTSEIAPPRDALDATILIDIRNQLAALPEPLRMPPLMDPSPLAHLARRAVFGWPNLTRLVSPDVEQRARAEVVRRATGLTGTCSPRASSASWPGAIARPAGSRNSPSFLGGPRE